MRAMPILCFSPPDSTSFQSHTASQPGQGTRGFCSTQQGLGDISWGPDPGAVGGLVRVRYGGTFDSGEAWPLGTCVLPTYLTVGKTLIVKKDL